MVGLWNNHYLFLGIRTSSPSTVWPISIDCHRCVPLHCDHSDLLGMSKVRVFIVYKIYVLSLLSLMMNFTNKDDSFYYFGKPPTRSGPTPRRGRSIYMPSPVSNQRPRPFAEPMSKSFGWQVGLVEAWRPTCRKNYFGKKNIC